MRHVLALAGIVLIAAGCATGPGPASPPGSAAVPGSPAPSAIPVSPPPTASPPATPPDAPTEPPPNDEVPARPDPAGFLQVCWDAGTPRNLPPIPCADAIETAIAAPDLAGATVARVDVRSSCSRPRACGQAGLDAVWVTVISDRAPAEVELVRGKDGGLTVATVGPGIAPTAPAFTPPATGRAELPGAPASLAVRPPYPLCGVEAAPAGGPYDRTARTCFWHGVLAGSPVEFASLGAGTEGGQFAHLYRYEGTGGVEFVTGEGGTWTRTFTGLAEAGGGLVFDVGGLSTRREPVP
jgi:hypothetical protein